MNGNEVFQDGKTRGRRQVEGGRRMEFGWPWVNLSHIYNCHTSEDAGDLEVQVEAQAGERKMGVVSRAGLDEVPRQKREDSLRAS